MSSRDLLADEPARIEREIVHTRASLHRKLEDLQHRLSPRERLREEAQRVTGAVRNEAERVTRAVRNMDPRSCAAAAALAAVGVGTAMAVQGLRRRNGADSADSIEPTADDFTGE
jgi:2-methylaconitate cis-trans-isomerase PrpF